MPRIRDAQDAAAEAVGFLKELEGTSRGGAVAYKKAAREAISDGEWDVAIYHAMRAAWYGGYAEGRAELEPDFIKAARAVLRSAAYEKGEAEPTLRELNVGIRYLDELREVLADAEGSR